MLIERSIQPVTNEYEIGSKVIYSYKRGSTSDKSIRPDALMTPLLYGYNHAFEDSVKTCIGDMPMLLQRERYANSLTLP